MLNMARDEPSSWRSRSELFDPVPLFLSADGTQKGPNPFPSSRAANSALSTGCS